MTKDVEALFRKINQADLPYRVFETNTYTPEPAEVAEPADQQDRDYSEPKMSTEISPPRTASIVPITRATPEAPAAPPAEAAQRPLTTASLFRRYAASAPETGEQPAPTQLSEIFARMKPKA